MGRAEGNALGAPLVPSGNPRRSVSPTARKLFVESILMLESKQLYYVCINNLLGTASSRAPNLGTTST